MREISILIVEDDEIDRTIVRQAIKNIKTSLIEEVPSGKKCLEILQSHKFDCIILDNLMPDINGVELFYDIKEVSSAAIILVTGHGDERLAVKLLKMGVDDYIPKEYIMKELEKSIIDAITIKEIVQKRQKEIEELNMKAKQKTSEISKSME